MPKEYKLALLEDRGYEPILGHRNYNPRVIEYMTQSRHACSVAPTLYRREFLDSLDNPARIWDHAFRHQISEAARHLLLVLATLPDQTTLENLEIAFWKFYRTTNISNHGGRMRRNQVIRRVAGYFGIVWLLLPVTLLAQGAPGSIQGIVCEIKTCKPIDGVQVSLVHPGSEVPVKTMRTDVSGEFGFFDLEPGTYMVRADNFIRRIGGASAVITNGERIENIKLELTALGTISGGAFDENGEPVVDARVEALAELMNSPLLVLDRMVAVPQAVVTTDNQGAFRISGLDA